MVFTHHPKLLEQIVQNTQRTLVGVAGLSFLVLLTFRNHIPLGLLSTWLVGQVMLLFFRYVNVRAIDRNLGINNCERVNFESKVFFALMVFSALWWDLILIGGAMYAPPGYEYFSFVVILGLITAAILSLSALINIYYVYCSLLLIPQLIFVVQLGEEVHIATALLSIVYIPYILLLSKSAHKNLVSTVIASERLLDSVDELHQSSITDPLTNLHNRRYFFSVSENLIALSIREKQEVSLLMLDIDYFKKINDTYGHQAGDAILIALAAEIDSMVRKSDVFARIGGEEFCLLLYDASTPNAVMLAQKICTTIENKVFEYNGMTIAVTLSIGVASLNEEDNTLGLLFKRADKHLYEAKNSGRNCCVA